MTLVVIESPLRAETPEQYEFNRGYARACMRDSLARNERPYASHLLFDQPGILDDTIPAERAQGIDAGLAWGDKADLRAVYTDLGISGGMVLGMQRANAIGQRVERRELGGVWREAAARLAERRGGPG